MENYYPVSKVAIERGYYPRKLIVYVYGAARINPIDSLTKKFEFDELDKAIEYAKEQLSQTDNV